MKTRSLKYIGLVHSGISSVGASPDERAHQEDGFSLLTLDRSLSETILSFYYSHFLFLPLLYVYRFVVSIKQTTIAIKKGPSSSLPIAYIYPAPRPPPPPPPSSTFFSLDPSGMRIAFESMNTIMLMEGGRRRRKGGKKKRVETRDCCDRCLQQHRRGVPYFCCCVCVFCYSVTEREKNEKERMNIIYISPLSGKTQQQQQQQTNNNTKYKSQYLQRAPFSFSFLPCLHTTLTTL